MKCTNVAALEKHLSEGKFAPVYLLVAKDDYARRLASDNTVHAMLQGRSRDLSLKVLDGESLAIDRLFIELQQVSLLVDRIVVLVQHGEKLKKAIVDALVEYPSHPNRSTVLIVSAESWHANSSFLKAVEKEGVLLNIAAEKPWEKEKQVREWLQRQVASRDKQFQATGAEALLRKFGTDQGLLEGEIEKLVCFVGDRPHISLQDIASVCGEVNTYTPWLLGEAILQRDVVTVLKIGRALLNDGMHFLALLVHIRRQLETDYQVCSLLSTGASREDISQAFPFMTGRILDKHITMAQAYGMARFKRGLLAVHEAETNAKNSHSDLDLLADMLLVKLTA